MNAFYIGSRNEYLEVVYAKSNRSTCRSCKKKIQKQQLRIAVCISQDHFSSANWCHLDCFQLKPRFKDIDPQQQIYQLDQLESQDYDKVVQYIKNQIARLKGDKKSKPKKIIKSQRSKSKSSAKSSKSKDDLKPTKHKSKDKKSVVQSDSQQKVTKKQKEKKKKKKTQKNKSNGYSSSQRKQFSDLFDQYFKKSNDQLKNILSVNGQPKTGTKEELARRCADGKMLGRIPMCSQCGGGKLRFDYQTGIYKCPGYMEDTDFIRCSATFQRNQITRTQWAQ